MLRIENWFSSPSILKKENVEGKLLHHEVCCISSNDLKAHRFKELMWKTAAISSIVGFAALMIGGNIVLSFYTPYFFYFIFFAAAVCMPFQPRIVTSMLQRAKKNHDLAEVDREIQAKFKRLNEKTPLRIKLTLKKHGFHPKRIQRMHHLISITDLNAGIARYLIWKKQPAQIQARIDALTDELSRLKTPQYIAQHKQQILEQNHLQAAANERAAFYQDLILHPLKA
jgi:hypothetical protein